MYGRDNVCVSQAFPTLRVLGLAFIIKVFRGSLCLLACVSNPFILIIFAGVPGSILLAYIVSSVWFTIFFLSLMPCFFRVVFTSVWSFLAWSAAIAPMLI